MGRVLALRIMIEISHAAAAVRWEESSPSAHVLPAVSVVLHSVCWVSRDSLLLIDAQTAAPQARLQNEHESGCVLFFLIDYRSLCVFPFGIFLGQN